MKIPFIVVLITQIPLSLFPQGKNNEISVSYGIFSVESMMDLITPGVIDIFSQTKPEETWITGGLFLGYRYHIDDVIGLGITAGIDQIHGDIMKKGEIVGNYSIKTLTFAGELKLTYINTEIMDVYFLAGLGYTFRRKRLSMSDTVIRTPENHLNLHADLLGLQFGDDILSVTAAIGYGYRGLFRFGLSYWF